MTKVSLVIQSNLNDAMIEMGSNLTQTQERLKFVKWMIHMFPDTNVRVDVDVVYKQFKLKEQVSLEN
jgi:hypothetical protein